LPNLKEKKKFEIFSPHLDSDFSLVAFFKLVFLLFREVLKTCHGFMLNPSWDGSQ
jgi:hypothetical protein